MLVIAISFFYFDLISRTEGSDKSTANINLEPSETTSLDNPISSDETKVDIGVEPSKTNSSNDSISDKEQHIYELFKRAASSNAIDETKDEFFNSIKDIDWRNLYKINKNPSKNASYEVLDWLYSNEISGETNIVNLLKATKGLDGAMSEGYSAIVAKLFLQDKRMFITCLSKIPADSIDNICFYVAYGCSYFDIKQITEDTEKMIHTEKLSNQEIIIVKKLIYSFNNIFR